LTGHLRETACYTSYTYQYVKNCGQQTILGIQIITKNHRNYSDSF